MSVLNTIKIILGGLFPIDVNSDTVYCLPADRPGAGDYKMPDVRPSVLSVRSSHFIKCSITPLFMNINSPNLHQKFVNNGMSLLTFGLILKNKMAARLL